MYPKFQDLVYDDAHHDAFYVYCHLFELDFDLDLDWGPGLDW